VEADRHAREVLAFLFLVAQTPTAGQTDMLTAQSAVTEMSGKITEHTLATILEQQTALAFLTPFLN
jgi:hypothetical protein